MLKANLPSERLAGTVDQLSPGNNGILRFNGRIWVPIYGGLGDLILQEAHNSKYSVHPGGDKIYQDLKANYWWMGLKKSIATHVAKCLRCSPAKAEHRKPSGLLQQLEIPTWKWEMDTHSSDKLAKLYVDKIVSLHRVPVSVVSDRDISTVYHP
ncbi:uncharacterized protein LOC110893475 [Helianthus annuus]|uniref:uncharacterized protein LOC110893475 n=1 Tax=Helianthus annuus TaxID=4232 RepID=UPI000B9037B7|nr:uncharacterized protein LOC110893475 [Helianthus annuus]